MGNLQKVFLALLLAISSIMGVSVGSNNVSDYLDSDCYSVAGYICDNLSEFKTQYNSILEEGEDPFEAECCEKQFDVVLLDNTETNATCLDFDGDNGYMIVADDYVIAAFQISGNLDYIDLAEEIFYDDDCGFEYFDEEIGYVPFLYNPEDIVDESLGAHSTNPYGIKNSNAYIGAKYGSRYSLYKSKSLNNWLYKNQCDFGLYSYCGGFPEQNCTILTIYSLLNYYATNLGYYKLPTGNSEISISNDSLYYSAMGKGWASSGISSLPTLYLKIREIAIKQYDYTLTGGLKKSNYEKLLKSVLSYYGYQRTSIKESTVFKSYSTYVMNQIASGKPSIFNIQAGKLYAKGHSVVITGYEEYRKVTQIKLFKWVLKFYSYVKLIEVDDGGQDCENGKSVFLDYSDTYRMFEDQMLYIKAIR